MIWKIKVLVGIACILFSCKQTKEKPVSLSYEDQKALIEVEELLPILDDPTIKIIDFRKKEKYLKGHLPNALNLWRTDIEDHTYPYKGMSANAKVIEHLLQGLGIQENDEIIIYDDNGSCDAARLWWVLHIFDFNRVKLLNGGVHAWKAAMGEFTTEIPEVRSSKFKLDIPKKLTSHITMDELSKMKSDNKQLALLDTRTLKEYKGTYMKKGANRSGRIPNSTHMNWINAIDENNNYKFRSYKALSDVYDPLITSKDTPVIAYCHTGVRSAHTTFVLTQLLGYTNVRNYDGSWSEWSYFENLPIEKDSVMQVLKE